MATSKGRNAGSGNSKTASRQSAPAKKSSVASSAASKAGRSNDAQKKSAAPKKAAAASSASKKSTATPKGGTTTAAKKATASRNGIASKSAAGRGTQSRNGAAAGGRGGASATASRSTSSARSGAASKKAKGKDKSTDPRNDLEKILQDLMQDIYYAEKKLTKALGKMSKAATDAKLKEAFLTHKGQTEEQVTRLEEAFGLLGQKPKSKRCAAMDGLVEEGNEHMEELERGAGLDAALIVGAQKIEHYEIAAYGSMRSFARTLGHSEVATIFEEIREQESDTDELLTTIAESVINLKAEGETEDVEGGGSNSNGNSGGETANSSDRGSEDSEAGEDSSSAVSGRPEENGDADNNDGAGRGISALTDGADRGEGSETGEPMGY